MLGKQASKSKRTQDAIINAVIELMNEGGFAAASSTQIARRSGVSWGAVQHHFGNKEEILRAVLQRSHVAFVERMQSVSYERCQLKTKVNRFVDAAWGHYQGNEFPAALEILLATRGVNSTSAAGIQFDRHEHLLLWRQIFKEASLTDEQMSEVIYTQHLMLTGILIENLLEQNFEVNKYLSRLKKIVLFMLSEAADE